MGKIRNAKLAVKKESKKLPKPGSFFFASLKNSIAINNKIN